MGAVLGIAILVGLIAGYVAYGSWLTKGIKPRSFETSLDPDRVRSLFEQRVARAGWKIVDDGNPMVAQSSLITGIRQQIGLTTRTNNGRTKVLVGPERWVTKFGVPKKGHTIRMRMNSFVEAVRAHDAAVTVTVHELHAR